MAARKALKANKLQEKLIAEGMLRDSVSHALTSHSALLDRFGEAEAARLVQRLQQDVIPRVVSMVKQKLKRAGDTISVQQARSALNDLSRIIKRLLGGSLSDLEGALERMATDESGFVADLVGEFDEVLDQSARILPASVAKKTVAEPVFDRPLDDWYRDVADDTAKRIQRHVTRGLVLGENLDTIIDDIERDDGVAFGKAKNAVAAVARTAVTHISNKVRAKTLEENGVTHYRFVATLDGRTSPQCRSLDGQVFKFGEGPMPPLHPNCRSAIVPDTSDLLPPGVKRPQRASADGPTDARSYDEWMREQGAEFQDAVLGKRKAQIFRRGTIPLEKFIKQRDLTPLDYDDLVKLESKTKGRVGAKKAGYVMARNDEKDDRFLVELDQEMVRALVAKQGGAPGRGTGTDILKQDTEGNTVAPRLDLTSLGLINTNTRSQIAGLADEVAMGERSRIFASVRKTDIAGLEQRGLVKGGTDQRMKALLRMERSYTDVGPAFQKARPGGGTRFGDLQAGDVFPLGTATPGYGKLARVAQVRDLGDSLAVNVRVVDRTGKASRKTFTKSKGFRLPHATLPRADLTKDYRPATQMDVRQAEEVVNRRLPRALRREWYGAANPSAKMPWTEVVHRDQELRDAGLTLMLRNRNKLAREAGDAEMTMDEFMQTPITLYRGGGFNQTPADTFASYSMESSIAEGFTNLNEQEYGQIESITVFPGQTFGSFAGLKGETEVLVPVNPWRD